MNKKKVLFVSEASYLNTGYATYSREVLKRLHATGKYVKSRNAYNKETNYGAKSGATFP